MLALTPLQFSFNPLADHVEAVFVALANGVEAFNGFRGERKGQPFRVELLASHTPKINRMYGIDKGPISYVRYKPSNNGRRK